jgi:hypothetical protein
MKNKKTFKVEYDTIKDLVSLSLFFFVVVSLVDSTDLTALFIYLSQATTGDIIGIGLTIAVLLYLIFNFSELIINLVYKVVCGDEKWYSELKELNIQIPITKTQYDSIKVKTIFSRKCDHPKMHNVFDSRKLKLWAIKIIEKELQKTK